MVTIHICSRGWLSLIQSHFRLQLYVIVTRPNILEAAERRPGLVVTLDFCTNLKVLTIK